MITKLESAKSKLEEGNTTAASNLLQAFVNHAESFISNGIISSTLGLPIIDKANNVKDNIDC